MNQSSQPRRQRVGLVLEGGGAKGAYAFGWLMEFAKRGVKFDAVAGTSVGALNAILWASNKIDAGHQLWRSISEETTLSIRRPRWFWSMLMIPYAFRRLVAERIANINDKVILSYLALFVTVLTVVPAVWMMTKIVEQTIIWGITWVSPKSGVGQTAREILGFLQGWLVLMSGLFGWLWFMFPEAWNDLIRFSWRSSLPLQKSIAEILEGVSIRIPTYVAAAEYREVSDPEQLRFFRGKAAPRGFWAGYDRYVPVYIPLHKTADDLRAHLVLASASLPYGVTLPVSDDGRLLVDGGVVDNSPVLPLIEHERCEYIVVIKLRQGLVQTSTQYPETYRRLQRLRLAAQLTPEAALRMRSRDEALTINEPPSWPDLVTIVPTRSLGSLLSRRGNVNGRARSSAIKEFRALLRFDPNYADRLIALGCADARAQSPEFWRRLGV